MLTSVDRGSEGRRQEKVDLANGGRGGKLFKASAHGWPTTVYIVGLYKWFGA